MKIWFTIIGTNRHYRDEFMEKDMPVHLEKEPDNEHDTEAIKVTIQYVLPKGVLRWLEA